MAPMYSQAALAACHAHAHRAADTDWPRIAALYDRLRTVAPSPVVDLNRAIAHSMAFGPEVGLRLLDEIETAALRSYAPLPAARGDFLFRAGRLAEAQSEFKAAASLTRTPCGKRRSSSRGPTPATAKVPSRDDPDSRGGVAADRFGFQEFLDTEDAELAAIARVLVATERRRKVVLRAVQPNLTGPHV